MKVAYQGLAGAYSEAATAALFPKDTAVPTRTFGEVLAALGSSEVGAAVVPVVEGDPARSPATEALALMTTCCAWIQVLGTDRAATTVLEPD